MIARRAWAEQLIRRGRALGAVPRYSSAAWRALSDNDPRKVAACVVAAECWVDHVDTLEQRLHAEVAAARAERENYEDEQWAVMAARIRGRANTTTHAQVLTMQENVTARCSGRRDDGSQCPRNVEFRWFTGWLAKPVFCKEHNHDQQQATG